MPLFIAIGMLQSFPAEGIKINGVVSHDPTDLIGPMALISIFLLLGGAMLAAAIFIRVEIGPQGVAVFNLFNRRKFSAWDEISRLELISKRGAKTWHIMKGDPKIGLPTVDDESSLMQVLLDNVRPNCWPPSERCNPSISTIDARTRSGQDGYALFFATLWYSFIGIFITVLVSTVLNGSSHGARQAGMTASGSVPFFFIITLFALLPFSSFKAAYFRFVGGSLTADQDHMAFSDGIRQRDIRWSEVKLAYDDSYVARSDGPSNMGGLTLVTANEAFEISSTIPQYKQLCSLASAAIPEDAHVYINPFGQK
ncbi:MAG: PH domain-containing protein [Armatimonadetes bacterium]|nr:PH domain-containing protein [Armatimonadota bacterium]